MKEIEKGWDEFWAKVVGMESYGDEDNAFKIAKVQVKHAIKVLKLKKGNSVLDIGCGAGFHSVELARKDLKVTGVDISSTLIKFAKNLCLKYGISCEFHKMDMRKIKFKNRFNAIVIFNQTFPVFNDKENIRVLKKFNLALKQKGRIYIQSLNPFVYARIFESYREWSKKGKDFNLIKVNFDVFAQSVKGERYYIKEGRIIGERKDDIRSINFRIFTPMQWMEILKNSGFKNFKFYGSQKIPLEKFRVSSKELIVVAEKK